ncbi:MAG: hypothetical protein IJM01_07725 [Eubacterium sp.]|nr:hypothetical protein [Eubacterium sp.]
MIGSVKRLKDEIYVRTTGRFVEGSTELDYLSNAAVVKIFEKQAKDAIRRHGYPELTPAQKAEIREYYRDCPKFDTIYHRVYYGRTGRVEPAYMPEELYYGYIEPYMVDHEAARYIDNKTYYGLLFSDIKQPETIAMRMGSVWYGGSTSDVSASEPGRSDTAFGASPVAKSEIPGLLRSAGSELILKIAENSEEGAGIFFLSKEDPVTDFKRVIREIKNDLIIQRVVKQHPAYAALHPESVNTLRIMSYLDAGGRERPKVEILTTAVRVGTGGLRVDNVTAGGFFLGIDDKGRTMGLGAGARGKVYREHPELGYDLKGIELPGIDKVYELIKNAHPGFGKFRIISWDFAIDEKCEPVLIEVNLALGGTANIQACSGPLFGDKTAEVCREVFGVGR